MGESPKITDPLAALEHARVQFEQAEDFTIAVEEEFAILEPATLEMTSGFERFDVAAREHPTLREMVAGELIRSEIEDQDRPLRAPLPRRPTRWPGGASTWSTWPQRRGSASVPPAPTHGRAGRTRR